MVQTWIVLIALGLVAVSAIHSLADFLSLTKEKREGVPPELADLYDEEKLKKSRAYLVDRTWLSFVARELWLVAKLALLLTGAFGLIDAAARNLGFGPVLSACVYFLALGALSQLLALPLSWFATFRLEQKYGFNRSTQATFFLDRLKGWALGIVIGGALLAGVVWFFLQSEDAWLYAWGFLSFMQILISFLAPVLLMPLFNKFQALPEGELRSAIESYAKKEAFKMQGVFTMDGSKRSARANAFFTGFGKFRRIVLFDTLIEKHPVPELVAVLAHEVGHFKRKHILKLVGISLTTSFALFYALSLLVRNETIAYALGFPAPSLTAGFTAAILLYGPLSLVLDLLANALSRKFEFEADAFAARTAGGGATLAQALKRLSADNLSSLNPHKLSIWLEYSHPPVVERVRALKDS